jgi:hypothetical protein
LTHADVPLSGRQAIAHALMVKIEQRGSNIPQSTGVVAALLGDLEHGRRVPRSL